MNYYAEIERYFIQRRGRGLMLSPKDWQLMDEWKDKGIPLRVVVRGIDKAVNQKGSQKREINCLAYCKPQIAECWREHKKQMLGSADPATGKPIFSKTVIWQHLSRLQRELQAKLKPNGDRLKLYQPVQNSLDELMLLAQSEKISSLAQFESKLEAIRQKLLEVLRASMPIDELSQIETAAEDELKSYRSWMRAEAYQATHDELVGERVLKFYGLPELRLYEP